MMCFSGAGRTVVKHCHSCFAIFLGTNPCRAAQVLENKRGKLAEKLRRQDVLIEKLREVHRLQDKEELEAVVREEIEEVQYRACPVRRR